MLTGAVYFSTGVSYLRQGTAVFAAGAGVFFFFFFFFFFFGGGGGGGLVSSILSFPSFFPSLKKTARYRTKTCLKELSNQLTPDQSVLLKRPCLGLKAGLLLRNNIKPLKPILNCVYC